MQAVGLTWHRDMAGRRGRPNEGSLWDRGRSVIVLVLVVVVVVVVMVVLKLAVGEVVVTRYVVPLSVLVPDHHDTVLPGGEEAVRLIWPPVLILLKGEKCNG